MIVWVGNTRLLKMSPVHCKSILEIRFVDIKPYQVARKHSIFAFAFVFLYKI